ncbi:uncharacterized protein VP01_9653g1, partial [Puccinia sorghi]
MNSPPSTPHQTNHLLNPRQLHERQMSTAGRDWPLLLRPMQTTRQLPLRLSYQAIAPPTVLRSERGQAGKKEYLTGCAKLEEILENALGLS